jgi:hypothetical protein
MNEAITTGTKAGKKKADSQKKYTVYEISNKKEKTKNFGKKVYLISSFMSPGEVISKMRTYVKSKTTGGGSKDMASDINKAGEDYDEYFTVKTIKSNLSKQRALEIKALMVRRNSNVYNKEIGVY